MIDALLNGLAISLLLVFSVGPVIFTIIKQSINHGKRGGFSFVAGVWLSDIIWVVLSNGFSEVVKSLLNFKISIGIAGSMFLLGMGIYFAFIKKIKPRQQQEAVVIAGDEITQTGKRKTNYFAIFSSGFLLNTLNPAVIAFWVAMAVSLAAEYNFYHRTIIFITCLAINMLADVGKVMGAGSIGNKLSDKNILRINRISGILYLVFALVILGGIIYSLL
ncbi:MAG: LysE family transporter [Chitinophagaceae bacterium]|nr:LysE family transporter [Chitinophagaceae bacterium]